MTRQLLLTLRSSAWPGAIAVASAVCLLALAQSPALGQDVAPPTPTATIEIIGTTVALPVSAPPTAPTTVVPPSSSLPPPNVSATSKLTTPPAVSPSAPTTVPATTSTGATTLPATTLPATTLAVTTLPAATTTVVATTTTVLATTTTLAVATTTRAPQIPLAQNPLRLKELSRQQQEILRDNAAREQSLAQVIAEQERQRELAQRGVEAIVDAQQKPTSVPRTSVPRTSVPRTSVPRSLVPPTEDLIDLRRLAAIRDYEMTATKNRVVLIGRENTFLQKGPIEWLGGFVNPVQRPYSTTDTFGAPRIGHRHEGIDLFAERGTPVRATVDGVIRDVKKTPIGGRIAYVTSTDGTYYYYAHLDRWAPGLVDGKQVIAGEIIGFVGRTGNAEATPPHVHFEIHPLGGGPINPFYVIDAVRTKNKALFEKWTVRVDELCVMVAKEEADRAKAIAAGLLPPTTRTTTTKPRPSAPSTYVSSTTIAAGVCPKMKASGK